MDNKKIAKILYSMSLCLDYADGIDYAEEEIQCIAQEIKQAGDSLKNVIETIALSHEDQENVYKHFTRSTINFYAECFDTFINISMTTSNIERAKEILDHAYEEWLKNESDIPLNTYLIQVLCENDIGCELEEGEEIYE